MMAGETPCPVSVSHVISLHSEEVSLPCTSCFVPSFLSPSSDYALSTCTARSNVYLALSVTEPLTSGWALSLVYQSILGKCISHRQPPPSVELIVRGGVAHKLRTEGRGFPEVSVPGRKGPLEELLCFLIWCKARHCHGFPFGMDWWEQNPF